jgi:hypothetical protein
MGGGMGGVVSWGWKKGGKGAWEGFASGSLTG